MHSPVAYSVDAAACFHICFQHGIAFSSFLQSKNEKGLSLRIKSMNLGKEYLVSVEHPCSTVQGHVMARSCCVVHSPTVFDQQLVKSVTSDFNKQS